MILIITHSSDFYTVDIVYQRLIERGVDSFRLNTDAFGLDYQFTYSPDGSDARLTCISRQETISVSAVKGVWYRKLWQLQEPAELDHSFRSIYQQEYQTSLHILFSLLLHLPWMNEMDAATKVNADKMRQLRLAAACGISIPETIMTNDADHVHSFYEKMGGQVIMKLHGSLTKNMSGSGAFFPTTRLMRDQLTEMDSLGYCPMIFQQEIDRAYELRVIYIDGDCFTGRIDAAGNERAGTTDWRTTSVRSTAWEPYVLPAHLCTKIAELMHRLNLTFGAIDIIRNPAGDYVFLEVNPQGEWGMLQRDLHYPIGETIADKLFNRII